MRMGVRSILAAPIRFERDTIGLLVVFAEHPFTFDEGDVAVAESLAHTVLVSMRKADAESRHAFVGDAKRTHPSSSSDKFKS
jgi:GAF domain-containing protein